MGDDKEDDEVGGKAKGGFARAEALSPAKRQEIAKKAAAARWGVREALYEGTVSIAGRNIGCYVLDDDTRVLARAEFVRAIGRTGKVKGGRQFDQELQIPVFLMADNLKPFITKEIEGNSKPVIFRFKGVEMIGYRAELLPDVCDVFQDAQHAGTLRPNQVHIADACRLLGKGLTRLGIIGLVDEATGFQSIRPRDALQKYLDLIIRKELAAWVKKFPDEFYENIYKLKGWPWPGMTKNRYSVVGHYTNNLVFERLAPGLLDQLKTKTPKDEKGQRPNKLHQWLTSDVGDPMLAQHLHSLILFQRLAIQRGYGWNRFLNMVDEVLPRRGQTLELGLPEPEPRRKPSND